MTNSLVSIIMPTWNCGKFIKESIASIQNQTYNNWELLIVDDCSIDNTEEIINSINDSRIKYIKNQVNCGAAVSRNKAIMMAKGKYVAFLDSDDLWVSNKLEKQISFMETNNYNFTYTNYEEINDSGCKSRILVTGPKQIGEIGMFNYCWPGCLTVMYNQEVLGKLQIPDLKKNNDYAMWLKLIKKSKCYLLNYTLAYYRVRKNSISHTKLSVLIKHHYYLFRDSENKNKFFSILLTINNLFYGFFKKIFYKKKMR